MIKMLRPVGNSLGLIIDRPILELLGIDRRTPLRVRTDGKVLYIEPVAGNGADDAGAPARRPVARGEKGLGRPGDKKSR
jgi:hypothetical protein